MNSVERESADVILPSVSLFLLLIVSSLLVTPAVFAASSSDDFKEQIGDDKREYAPSAWVESQMSSQERAKAKRAAKPTINSISIAAQYANWNASRADGSQTALTATIARSTNRYGVLLVVPYLMTDYRAVGKDDRFKSNSLADLRLTTYLDFLVRDFGIRTGVDVAFPTGTSSFSIDQYDNEISPDDLYEDLLIESPFGAGLDISPHLSVTKPISSWFTLGIGARYTIRGSYEPYEDPEVLRDSNYSERDPGDRLRLALNGVFTLAERRYLLFAFTYNAYQPDKLKDGTESFKSGDAFTVEARYLDRPRNWFSYAVGLVYRFQNKNKRGFGVNELSYEDDNSNSNKLSAYFSSNYRLSDRWTLLGSLGYKAVGANAYDDTSLFHDAGRDKLYISPGARFLLRQGRSYIIARFSYAWIRDKKDLSGSRDMVDGTARIEEETYNRLGAALSYTLTF